MSNPILIRLALSDHQDLVRKGIIEIVHSFGDMVVETETNSVGQLAELLSEKKMWADICLVAVNDRLFSQLEQIRKLKQRFSDLKVLVLSAYETEFAITQMISAGVNGYLLKDSSRSELRRAITQIYSQGFYYSDLVSPAIRIVINNSQNPRVINFSDRESQFMSLSTNDITYKEIAQRMNVSTKTVENYRDTLFARLKIKSRPGLVAYAFKNGIV